MRGRGIDWLDPTMIEYAKLNIISTSKYWKQGG